MLLLNKKAFSQKDKSLKIFYYATLRVSCTNIHYHMVTEWCRRVLVALIGPFASKQLFCYTNPELSLNYFWKVLFHFIGLICITDYPYFLLALSIELKF